MLKDNSKNHELANKLTPIRIQLEKFLLDYSDGRLKNKNDSQILKEAIDHIKKTIAQIDEILC